MAPDLAMAQIERSWAWTLPEIARRTADAASVIVAIQILFVVLYMLV